MSAAIETRCGASVAELLLSRAIGRGVDFRRSDFTGVRFCDVPPGAFHLSRVYLWRLQAPWADFSGVGMSCADFRFANLQRAVFCRAHAPGAKFWGADLRGADFRGANIEGACFRGADMTGTLFDEGVVLDCLTLPPDPHPAVVAEYGTLEDFYRENPMNDFRGL